MYIMSSDEEMNVVDAYKKFKGQLIILVTGLSACGKSKLGKFIAEDFKLTYLNQFNYYKQDYSTIAKLPDGREIINWDDDDAVDWDKLNKDIIENSKNGVIVSGFALPDKLLKFKPDYHLHISMSKKTCLDKRKEYIISHKDKHQKEFELIGTPNEHLQFNRLTFPYYLGLKERTTINKYLNANEKNDDEMYDESFNLIIDMMEKYLSQYGETSRQSESVRKEKQQTTDNSSGIENTELYKEAKKRTEITNKMSVTVISDEFGPQYPYAEFY